MSRRNIILGLLGTLVVFQAGDWVLTNVVQGPLDARSMKKEKLENRIKQRRAELADIRKEGKAYAVWESQSLPSDPEVARSQYQSWLLELVGKVGFAGRHVDSGTPVNRSGGLYQSITFSVRGRGTLAQLTSFLFEFYSANHLHQIRSLLLTPLRKSEELDFSLSIEALILPTTDRKNQLATGSADLLASRALADYAPIFQRNLLGMGTGVDPADQAYLTAVTNSNGSPEAWFTLRDVGKLLKLCSGQEISVGQVSGTIVEIVGSDVVIETEGGERWLMSVGDSLSQAFALPPEF